MKTQILFVLLLVSISFAGNDGYIKTQQGTLHYITYGSGEPLLIVNGGPGLNCNGFESVAELFADHYQTILFDQRGTGGSTLDKTDSTTVTLDLMAQDMETLRKHLKINKWVLLGHSFGGWLSQHYATLYPENIKGLVLSSSGGIDMGILKYFNANKNIRLSQGQIDSLKYWNDRIKQGDTTYTAQIEWAKNLAPAYVYHKEYVPMIAKRLTEGNKEITSLVYKDMYKIQYNCREKLKNFEKPVLIIQGRQDLLGDGTAYEAQKVYKNSRIVFLNECVHYGFLERRETYKAEIEKFIESVES